jgi:hypothetical protein
MDPWRGADSISNALPVAVTHVIIYPDDWDGLGEATRIEYSEAAAEHGIELRIADPATTNPDQLVTVSNGDFTAIAAPFYLGPVLCNRPHWEHNLRELLDMDDPCFPNPFRGRPRIDPIPLTGAPVRRKRGWVRCDTLGR